MSEKMPVRTGLWPRAIALLIDGCLITLVLGFLGLALFVPTGGRIRVAEMLVGSQTCAAQNQQVLQDLQIPLPPNFQATHLVRCTKTLLGYVHDRVLIVAELTHSGAATVTRELTFPLDARGLPAQPFYLDSLWFLVFAAYVLLLEWRAGRTLGKDLMDVRVQSSAEGTPTLGQVVKRFLVRFFPGILVGSLSLMSIAGVTATTAPAFFWSVWLASLLSSVAVLVNFVVEVRRNALPWHDRFAGTEVVLGR
jgi:uncharacterized RDD family membrane protein YckC